MIVCQEQSWIGTHPPADGGDTAGLGLAVGDVGEDGLLGLGESGSESGLGVLDPGVSEVGVGGGDIGDGVGGGGSTVDSATPLLQVAKAKEIGNTNWVSTGGFGFVSMRSLPLATVGDPPIDADVPLPTRVLACKSHISKLQV